MTRAHVAYRTKSFNPWSKIPVQEKRQMQPTLYYMITVAVFAVLAVLIAGLYTMLRQKNPRLSQTLMRWRVGLQLLALLLVAGFLFLAR